MLLRQKLGLGKDQRIKAIMIVAILILGTISMTAQPVSGQAPTLASSTFFGGSGDQGGDAVGLFQPGVAISSDDASIYILGGVGAASQTPADTSIFAKYSKPPTSLPEWSRTWSFGALWGIASTNEGVYTTGWSHPGSGSGTSDGVGGTEVKGILAKFSPDGSSGSAPGGAVWVATPNIFAYRGVEILVGVTTAVESGSTFIYTTGGAEPCSFVKFVILKFDTSGNLISKATEQGFEPDFNTSCAVFSVERSVGVALTHFDGNIYSVGERINDGIERPAIWKHNTDLIQTWKQTSTIVGRFLGVTAFDNFIYAVGFSDFTNPQYLIEKYDVNGNLIWQKISGGTGIDVLEGIVSSGNRLFAVGHTTTESSGGADAVILEIDPATGNTLATTFFGGAQDDRAHAVATGSDLYVAGESRSFAEGGNTIGQNDLMLLRYTTTPTNNPPTCNTASPNASTLWPPNHKMNSITIAGVTDADGDTVTITIVSIKQDEPTNGLGDGDKSPDGSGVGTSTAQVRAERAATGDGRVYQIAFTAGDGKGGSCSGVVFVGIPHDQRGIPANEQGPLFDSTVP